MAKRLPSVNQAGRALRWTFEAHGGILDSLSAGLRESLKLDATDWATRLAGWKRRVAELRAVGEEGRRRG